MAGKLGRVPGERPATITNNSWLKTTKRHWSFSSKEKALLLIACKSITWKCSRICGSGLWNVDPQINNQEGKLLLLSGTCQITSWEVNFVFQKRTCSFCKQYSWAKWEGDNCGIIWAVLLKALCLAGPLLQGSTLSTFWNPTEIEGRATLAYFEVHAGAWGAVGGTRGKETFLEHC